MPKAKERKKPGPKPLPPEERLERRSVRLSQKDWDYIALAAGKVNVPTSDYIRRAALSMADADLAE